MNMMVHMVYGARGREMIEQQHSSLSGVEDLCGCETLYLFTLLLPVIILSTAVTYNNVVEVTISICSIVSILVINNKYTS